MHWLLLLFLALIAGCARPQGAPTEIPPGRVTGNLTSAATNGTGLIITPSNVVKGKITSVNRKAAFVVISYPVGVLPQVGTRLNVYRKGLKVGEIKITGPQRDVNIAGDIVAGECQLDDEVRPD